MSNDISIRTVRKAKGEWVEVDTPKGWRPSFRQIGQILREIVGCERRRYRDLPWHPGSMVINYIKDAILTVLDWDAIDEKHGIPLRESRQRFDEAA